MVKTSFGSYGQFKEFFRKAPRNVQNILYKAYPQWARQLTEEYIAATKKISGARPIPNYNPNNPAISRTLEFKNGRDNIGQQAQPLKGAIPKQISMAKDTVKGVNKATQAVSKGLGFLSKVPKGAVGLVGKAFAPIQGVANLASPDADLTDKISGGVMLGAGGAALVGAPFAAGTAATFAVGDMLKKYAAAPIGEAIGKKLYGTGDYGSNEGLIDIYNAPDTLNTNLTPEQRAKVDAYNKNVIAQVQAEADASLARNKALQDEYTKGINTLDNLDRDLQNTQYGGDYMAPSPATTQATSGFYSQNSQNGQEGGLNEIQDNLYLEQYKPSLKPIVEPVNYSNEYLASQNNLINQLYQNANQGVQQQMSMNNPYDLGDIRPYAQIDNQQLAPVPTQQQGLDYGALINQFNAAMDADRRQNAINTLANMNNYNIDRAPIYYVGAKGDLRSIKQDQMENNTQLPTNTSSNYDKLMGQIKLQAAQEQARLAQQKQQAADLKAQREYIDNQLMRGAFGKQFNVDPNMFANPEIAKAALQYVFNPNIQAQANVQETIGKAPIEATLEAAKQRGLTAGKLDEIQLQSQFDAMIANINNNAKLEEQAMIQNGMDGRKAAEIAAQNAMLRYGQAQQNYRAMLEDQRARDLAEYGRGTQWGVADRYASARGGSEKPTLTLGQQVYLESVKSGTPIPQAIKYAQVADPSFGLSQAEQAELNRR